MHAVSLEEEKQTKVTADVHSIAKLTYLAQDEAASTEAECCSSKNGYYFINTRWPCRPLCCL